MEEPEDIRAVLTRLEGTMGRVVDETVRTRRDVNLKLEQGLNRMGICEERVENGLDRIEVMLASMKTQLETGGNRLDVAVENYGRAIDSALARLNVTIENHGRTIESGMARTDAMTQTYLRIFETALAGMQTEARRTHHGLKRIDDRVDRFDARLATLEGFEDPPEAAA